MFANLIKIIHFIKSVSVNDYYKAKSVMRDLKSTEIKIYFYSPSKNVFFAQI